jgi:cytochrome c oxidase cbb3-type subunit III
MECLALTREEENRKVFSHRHAGTLRRQRTTTHMRDCFCRPVLFAVLCLASFSACKREQRQFQQPPASFKTYNVTMSDIRPGSSQPEPTVTNESEQKAYEVSEGKRLFTQYNCSGCHFNGGGGIGPALMDAQWIYGEKSENIYATIVEGRPNGMPSFRHKIPDSQVWQIVAYVRSMSGQLRKDVAPNRSDDMSGRRSEQRTERKKPEGSGLPPSAQHP